MAWLSQNWAWVLFLAAFIGMLPLCALSFRLLARLVGFDWRLVWLHLGFHRRGIVEDHAVDKTIGRRQPASVGYSNLLTPKQCRIAGAAGTDKNGAGTAGQQDAGVEHLKT